MEKKTLLVEKKEKKKKMNVDAIIVRFMRNFNSFLLFELFSVYLSFFFYIYNYEK